MAERRMFSRELVTSDLFLDMPPSAQVLYFLLAVVADDDGFVTSPKSVMRQCGASQDDMTVLIQQGYILSFDSGIIVIRHWRQNNYLRADRYTPSKCIKERAMLTLDASNAYIMASPGDPPVPVPGSKSPADPNGTAAGRKRQEDDPFIAFAGENKELLEALQAFADTREASGKALTNRAKQLLMEELVKLSRDPATQTAIINQSITRGWHGFFPLERSPVGRSSQQSGTRYNYDITEGSF